MPRRLELSSADELRTHLLAGRPLAGCALVALDLNAFTPELLQQPLGGCLLLGCRAAPELLAHAQATRASAPDSSHGRSKG